MPAKVLGFAEFDCEKGAIVEKFSELRAFFRDPINSTKIGIWFSNKLSEKVKFVQLNSISTNLLKIPFVAGFVVISSYQLINFL